MEKYGYRFSFGPWNIHEGADPFGPPVGPSRDFESKLAVFKELGFDMVQFHVCVVGLDVKAVRTQPASIATKHLRNSLRAFLRLLEISRALEQSQIDALISERDYEELDWLILNRLMGD